MSISYNLMNYVVLFPAALLCYLPMKNQLRFGRKVTAAIGVPTLAALVTTMALLETRYGLGSVLTIPLLVVCFLLYCASLRVSISKALGFFAIVLALFSILLNLSICADAIRGLDLRTEADQMRSIVFYAGLCAAAALAMAWPFSKYGAYMIDQETPDFAWLLTGLIGLINLLSDLHLAPIQETLYEDRRTMQWMLLMFFIHLARWFLLQILFYYTVKSLKAGAEAEERNRFFEMREYQYRAMQQYIRTSERTRHDFRQSIRTLNELYDAGDYEALGKYLHQYAEGMPVREITSYTEHMALNALLNFYVHVAGQHGIAFEMKVSVPESLPVSDMDLCSMVGNILENAVAASLGAEKPSVRLTVVDEDGTQLYIVAVNSFDGKVRMRNGAYLSTRHAGDGIGLSSVVSTAEKYGGIARFRHEGTTFYSNVAIPLSRDKGGPAA